jgi:hypothetical protein
MLLNETFFQLNIEIRNVFFGQRRSPFMNARLAQKRTIQRAIDRDFAPGPTALGANFTFHAGTKPAGTPLFAKLTKDTHRETSLSYHRKMPRTDLYLKVEIDLDQKEQPERLALEICRQIRRVYGVRAAELMNVVERETKDG